MIATPAADPAVIARFDALLRRLHLADADETALRDCVTVLGCSYAEAMTRASMRVLADALTGEPTVRDCVDVARRAAYAHGG